MSKVKYFPLNVNYSSYSYVTNAGDPDDSFSRDSTASDSNPTSVSLCVDKESTLAVPFEGEKNDDVYLLWITYTTGDSFGSDSGNFLPIAVFKTMEKAEAAKSIIKLHDFLESSNALTNEFSVFINDELGFENCISATWAGYFESLDSIEITKFSLQETAAYTNAMNKNKNNYSVEKQRKKKFN